MALCLRNLQSAGAIKTDYFCLNAELLLMFQLMDRVRGGVDPMIANLESYIVITGLDDMKASADTITSVSDGINLLWIIERFSVEC